MASEFHVVWKDKNAPEYYLNATNLSAISPHLLHTGKELLVATNDSKSKLTLLGNSAFKIIQGGVHKLYGINDSIEFNPAEYLDTGESLIAGTDYYVYMVVNEDDTASIVVSLNDTYPDGAIAEASRLVGGFHTLCADVALAQEPTHALYEFLAGNILPMSVWDLLKRPKTCKPQGMVLDVKTGMWVDIYNQSGTGENTKSVFNGVVTNSRSWDSHVEDFLAVGKRMLKDHEFTSAALGIIPYRVVLGEVDPITTGGKVNTDNMRIISDIGCEDMVGCYWQWIDADAAVHTGEDWVDTEPDDQGKVYQIPGKLMAGGDWVETEHVGARCRVGIRVRSYLYGNCTSRGCAESLTVI